MALSASELRIGNWVKPNSPRHREKYLQVESIFSDVINFEFRPYSIDEIEPIPLSEEILLKCGFEKKGEYLIYGEFKLWRYINEVDNVWLLEDWPYQCDVIHIHQLQNVYFALTGQELNTSGL